MTQNIGFEDAAHKAIGSSMHTGKYDSPQLCGIFEAGIGAAIRHPMFRFAAHGVTEVRPLRGQDCALRTPACRTCGCQMPHPQMLNAVFTVAKRTGCGWKSIRKKGKSLRLAPPFSLCFSDYPADRILLSVVFVRNSQFLATLGTA